MSREIEKIADALFEKIRSRFDNVSIGDEQAKDTADPEKARFFNFDYISSDGENFGNVTVSLIDENSLKIYFSKNISQKLNDEQRKDWFDFLSNLRFFAKRNLLTFDTRDISRSNLNLKDLKTVTKSDATLDRDDIAMNESRMYGTPKTSFENVGNARIRVIHTEAINPDQRGSRSRHINAIYVETIDGERFRMSHNKLSGARAMARHISEGGRPWDDIGEHITGIVNEMSELGHFVRTMRHRTFEDNTTIKMVEAAAQYYNGMHRQLNHLKSTRAYRNFVENYQPSAQQLDEVDVNELKEKFVKKIFDDRMTAALPHVYKAYKLQEQAEQRQLQLVRDIIENRLPLQLTIDEGMDDYIRTLNFSSPGDMVVRVLEDIAQRSKSIPEIAEFAQQWAKNYNNINEDSDQALKEHQALAVKLATHYLRDLRNLKENSDLRIHESEIEIVDFDAGEDILAEGTWALPKTPEDIQELQTLLANPLPVGTDGENATSALYNLLGDDELFDRLGSYANDAGPKADARDIVKNFVKEQLPGLYTKMGLNGEEQMDQEPPAAPPQPGQPAQAGDPNSANQPAPPPQPTGTSGMDTPQGANLAENEELKRMLRIAGLK
jgi:hypothetical protein